MKRLLIMLGAFFCVVASVNAYENTLRFIESDNSIYYDSEKYDDNLFMNHLDMIPGEENEDVLHIENTTDKEFTLYFRVVDKEYTEEEAELIDNTTMTIFIDDDIIYNGSIDGENHSFEHVDSIITVVEKKTIRCVRFSETYVEKINEKFLS